MTIGGLLPNQVTNKHRHTYETVLYVIKGTGWTEIEDQIIEWEAGDAVYIPSWAWHKHGNMSEDYRARYIAAESAPQLQNLGVALREEEGREERIRKEQEAREDRIRKEQEDREEARENRLRKERMEEVSRREEREREHRITKLRDEIDAYLCKIDVIVKSNPISHVALIEDLRLYIGKLSEYSASYYHLVSKLKGLVNSSDTEYQPKLDYVLDYIYSGNEKIDALMKEANMEGIIRAEKEKAELVEKENMREIARREKEELISNRMLNEIIVIEMELSEV